jgi:type VI secretion system protein ImpG
MKGDAVSHIKELLELYNLPKSKENHLIIDAIKKLSLKSPINWLKPNPFQCLSVGSRF